MFGKHSQHPLAELGEAIWWRPLQVGERQLGPLDDRYEEGIYLGPIDGRNCVYVAQGDAIVQARSVKRRPLADRWSKDAVMKIKNTELQPNGPGSEDERVKIRAP
eukprot:7404152-Karenia_brevis.AAC.1